jgi:hypothetical protein
MIEKDRKPSNMPGPSNLELAALLIKTARAAGVSLPDQIETLDMAAEELVPVRNGWYRYSILFKIE